MSITNGERLATKQDLADMYQGILPYLGGMPEVLANKFSKGDLYSTDEKIIGQWYDGKPLYQKTFEYNTATSGTTDVTVGQIQNMDVGFVVDGFYINQNVNFGNKGSLYMLNNTGRNASDTSYDSYFMVKTDGTIVGLFGSNSASSKIVVTVRYTKTTDSAISIGSDTDYSTEEKIVGTWIDGSPIWQKTVSFGALPNSTTKEVAHNISNIDAVVSVQGIAFPTDKSSSYPLPYTSPTALGDAILLLATKSIIRITTNYNRSGLTNCYVTIQYTKTS